MLAAAAQGLRLAWVLRLLLRLPVAAAAGRRPSALCVAPPLPPGRGAEAARATGQLRGARAALQLREVSGGQPG